MLASQERLAQNDHNMEMTMLSSLPKFAPPAAGADEN